MRPLLPCNLPFQNWGICLPTNLPDLPWEQGEKCCRVWNCVADSQYHSQRECSIRMQITGPCFLKSGSEIKSRGGNIYLKRTTCTSRHCSLPCMCVNVSGGSPKWVASQRGGKDGREGCWHRLAYLGAILGMRNWWLEITSKKWCPPGLLLLTVWSASHTPERLF